MATDCSVGVSQQAADVNVLNLKMLAEDTISDISINRKSLLRHQDAWETQRLRQAQFHASFDHALLASMAIANQTGGTDNQAFTSPIRTGAADTETQQPAGAVYPPIRNVDQGGAAAQSGIYTAMQALADAVANLQNALTSVDTNAAGGASTPSQTSSKPTS